MNNAWTMQLSLRVGEHGWSDLDLWLDDDHRSFCITHIFNSPLTDLSEALLSLAQGAEKVSFDLHEEPGQHIWEICSIPEERHLLLVEIRSYSDNFELSKAAYKIMEFRVARDFFIQSFMAELEKIAVQLNFPRFARERDSNDFPWQVVKELRDTSQ